jgi:hypothetical protein
MARLQGSVEQPASSQVLIGKTERRSSSAAIAPAIVQPRAARDAAGEAVKIQVGREVSRGHA